MVLLLLLFYTKMCSSLNVLVSGQKEFKMLYNFLVREHIFSKTDIDTTSLNPFNIFLYIRRRGKEREMAKEATEGQVTRKREEEDRGGNRAIEGERGGDRGTGDQKEREGDRAIEGERGGDRGSGDQREREEGDRGGDRAIEGERGGDRGSGDQREREEEGDRGGDKGSDGQSEGERAQRQAAQEAQMTR